MPRVIRAKMDRKERLAYESRGLPVPWPSAWSRRPFRLGAAMLHNTDDRDWHARYANRHGLFWLPCPTCRRYFGGHEIHGSVRAPEKGPGRWVSICTYCLLDGKSQDRGPQASQGSST